MHFVCYTQRIYAFYARLFSQEKHFLTLKSKSKFQYALLTGIFGLEPFFTESFLLGGYYFKISPQFRKLNF